SAFTRTLIGWSKTPPLVIVSLQREPSQTAVPESLGATIPPELLVLLLDDELVLLDEVLVLLDEVLVLLDELLLDEVPSPEELLLDERDRSPPVAPTARLASAAATMGTETHTIVLRRMSAMSTAWRTFSKSLTWVRPPDVAMALSSQVRSGISMPASRPALF